jgi:small subunit ribosomal protein S8
MSMNDPLGDMLTRIRNAQMRRKGSVATPGSRLRARVLDVLKSEVLRRPACDPLGRARVEAGPARLCIR